MARILSIALLSVAVGGASAHSDEACMLSVTNGITELARSGTFLYSAIERCETGENGIQCSSDIFSTIEYVLKASGFIVKSIEACGHGEKAEQCQLTSLKLASAASGLTATSLEMSASCTAKKHGYGKKFPLDDSVPCLGNIAGAITSLGSTIAGLATIKDKCKDKADCYASTLDILSSVAGMGGAIWATVSGSCIIDKALQPYNECVVATVNGAKNLMALGSAALTLSKDCKLTEEARLYEDIGKPMHSFDFGGLNTGLAALFPFTAVVAFVRGTRDGKNSVAASSEHELISEI